jgi:hypothetical protein
MIIDKRDVLVGAAPIDNRHHLTRFVPKVISDDGSQDGIIHDGLHGRASGPFVNATYRN